MISHAVTEATRQMRFPLDEPLNVQGAADAAASIIGRIDRTWRRRIGPCAQTAALGLSAEAEPKPQDWDVRRMGRPPAGRTGGQRAKGSRTLANDPAATPHDGESLAELVVRDECRPESAGAAGRGARSPSARACFSRVAGGSAGAVMNSLLDKGLSEPSNPILFCCFAAGQPYCRRCAPGETRTPNLLIRSQMLYPLSYGRLFCCRPARI